MIFPEFADYTPACPTGNTPVYNLQIPERSFYNPDGSFLS